MADLNVALVGAGRISGVHAIGYREARGARIYAVCDPDRGAGERLAREFAAEQVYTDFEQVLADPRVDIVEITTPNHLHASMAVAALDAGKHASIEKPMAVSLAEGDAIVAAAQRSPAKARVTENFLFYAPHIRARELIAQGAIGDPVGFWSRLTIGDAQYGWEIPPGAGEWRNDRARAGGGSVSFDYAAHPVALAEWLVGPITEVYTSVARQAGDGGDLGEGIVTMLWKHDPARSFGMADCVPAPAMKIPSRHYAVENHTEVTGTKGILWITRIQETPWRRAPVIVYADGVTTAYHDTEDTYEGSFQRCAQHLIDAIRNDTEPEMTPARARSTLRVLLAGQRALEKKRGIAVTEVEQTT